MAKHDSKRIRVKYVVQVRNGYWPIDLYIWNEENKKYDCARLVDIYQTRKIATSTAQELNTAYKLGLDDGADNGKDSTHYINEG